MLLARREGGCVSFRLREGVGEWVDRAPWRIEWGGGSSVENPHVQRVHYCQLLVRMRALAVRTSVPHGVTTLQDKPRCSLHR